MGQSSSKRVTWIRESSSSKHLSYARPILCLKQEKSDGRVKMFRREKISTSVFSFFLLFISSFTDKEETIKKKRKSDVMSAGRMFNHYDARMVVFLPGIMIKHT